MTLPVYPNTLSVAQLKTEFSTNANDMNSYHLNEGGPVFPGQVGYPGAGAARAIPSSGTIALGDFHGSTGYIPVARTLTLTKGSSSWTVPNTLISDLTITVIGGGGGGCHWPSGAAGGAGGGGCRFIGRIPSGTVISYVVGGGGPSVRHDSTRYARDALDTRFGVSGDSWYMYVPGLGTGGYNMSGGNRGPGVGSYGRGGPGVSVIGTGGNGKPERTSGAAGSATNIGGGGGACDRPDSSGGSGAGGGNRGGNRYENGLWPGGGGSGNNSASPTPWTTTGGDGAIIISGTW